MNLSEKCRIARLVTLWGKSDEEIAFVLDMDIVDMAALAMDCEPFYDAITPSMEEVRLYEAACRERKEKRNARIRSRLKTTPSARIRKSVASRMWAALKGVGRHSGLFSRLGYGAEELVAHLESRFQPGMSWENYGRWHIDHKKPCALFDLADREQFDECWSLSNLQPLWAAENVRKGAKYVGA